MVVSDNQLHIWSG